MAAAAALMANLAVVRSSALPSMARYNLHKVPIPFPRIICGPRDNRGPLVRGRTLSTEAILAVQALKRAAMAGDLAASKVDGVVSNTLVRLIKSDLLAALTELQRQNHWSLALKVFVAMRREIWYSVDYASYAQMISTLAKNGMVAEIDELVSDLLEEDRSDSDLRGYARLMKVLIAVEKGEAVKNLYRGLKRKGFIGDEYSFKIISKGLRKLGEIEAADEVEEDYAEWCDNGGRPRVLAV